MTSRNRHCASPAVPASRAVIVNWKNAKKRFLWLLVVLLGNGMLATNSLAQTKYGAVCDGCTQQQYHACAQYMGWWYGLSTNTRIFVFDFINQQAVKYRLQVVPPGGSVDSDSESFIQGLPDVFAFPETLSANEENASDLLIQWTNEVTRPNGGGQTVESCPGSATGTPAVLSKDWSISEQGTSQSTQSPALKKISVPANLAESAFDVIGNQSASIHIAQQLLADQPVFNFFGQIANFIDDISNMMLNVSVVLRLEFSDGSAGIWTLNRVFMTWEADFSTFRDSDNNPIPHTPADLIGNTYHFSGQSPGESNLANFLDRAQMFGAPITGPGGGGGGVPTECRMEGDDMVCRPAPNSD